ncbi:hypothetical protein TrVGV298_009194 [Trichoderma virens]|nr:hypothetical protein TrVGV298_009194 [Trichoderma virens]
MAQPSVFLWALDTRNLWPEASNTKDLPKYAHRALALLSPDEQAAVLKYYFVKDAKLSLASALLKRLAISRHCRVPWRSATAVRDARTKPVFLLPSGEEPLLFNVTHQAGVAVLFGAYLPPRGRRHRHRHRLPRRAPRPRRQARPDPGLAVLHRHARRGPVSARGASHARPPVLHPAACQAARLLLRKLVSARGLRQDDGRRSPRALVARPGDEILLAAGEAPPEGADKSLEVWFKGEKLTDVDVKLDWALGNEYMISTVVRRGEGGQGLEVPEPEVLDLEETLASAEALLKELGE